MNNQEHRLVDPTGTNASNITAARQKMAMDLSLRVET